MKIFPPLALMASLIYFHAPAQDAAEQTPICSTPRQCEVMWGDAQEALGMVSNMRIRLISDTRIETFGPTTYGRVGGVVTKTPVGETGYQIKLRLECYRSVPCADIQGSGTRLFNRLVNGVPNSANSPPKWPKPSDNLFEGTSTASPSTAQKDSPPATKPTASGKDALQAQSYAREQACHIAPQPSLAAKGPGFETYSIPCSNGDTLIIRCEYGNCRALR